MAKRKFSLMGEVQGTSQTDAAGMNEEPKSRSADKRGNVKDYSKDSTDSLAEVRATFIVSPVLIRKLKLIGTLENRKHKDIVGTALSEYIEKWENKHPAVDLDEIDNLVK